MSSKRMRSSHFSLPFSPHILVLGLSFLALPLALWGCGKNNNNHSSSQPNPQSDGNRDTRPSASLGTHDDIIFHKKNLDAMGIPGVYQGYLVRPLGGWHYRESIRQDASGNTVHEKTEGCNRLGISRHFVGSGVMVVDDPIITLTNPEESIAVISFGIPITWAEAPRRVKFELLKSLLGHNKMISSDSHQKIQSLLDKRAVEDEFLLADTNATDVHFLMLNAHKKRIPLLYHNGKLVGQIWITGTRAEVIQQLTLTQNELAHKQNAYNHEGGMLPIYHDLSKLPAVTQAQGTKIYKTYVTELYLGRDSKSSEVKE